MIVSHGRTAATEKVDRRAELAAVAFLVVCGVGWAVLVSMASCPLSIPRNDAFAYSQVAQTLSDHGKIELVGYARMSLIGHIVLAQPFFLLIDNREVAGNLFGITMMALTIVLSYALARRLLRRGQAIVVTLTFAFLPGLADSTPTFMTETTFLALTVATLLTGVLGFQSARFTHHWLILSAVLGFVGVTVREFGVVAPFVVIASLVAAQRVSRTFAASVAGILAIACAAFYAWHQHLPGLQSTVPNLTSRSLALPVLALFTLGFWLLPATLPPAVSMLRNPDRLLRGAAFVTATLALPAVLLTRTHSLFLHDMLERDGSGGQAVLRGVRPQLFPLPIWIALNAMALVGGICLVVVVIDLVRSRVGNRERDALLPLEAFAAAYAVLLVANALVFGLLEDRYAWALTLPVGIIVVARTARPCEVPARRGTAWLVGAPLMVLLATSTFVNEDVAAYDGARWAAAQSLVARGAAPDQVDGGYEWQGAHATTGPDVASADNRIITPSEPYYAGFWPPAVRCFVVSNSPPEPGGQLLELRNYRSQLLLRTRTLYVWLRPGPDCRSEFSALRPAND